MADWTFNDGGRADAGFKGTTGDCVTRAISIATGKPYREVYDELHKRSNRFYATTRSKKRFTKNGNLRKGSPRDGAFREVYEPYLSELGWKWTPTMQIGSGCRVHLRADELPGGAVVASVSRHLSAVIDGVVHDTHDPTRDGTRCVYGYYAKEKHGTHS